MKILIIVLLLGLCLPANAVNLTYTGNKELCITSINGSVTCIEKNDQYEYTPGHDYMLEIRDITTPKTFSNLLDFFTDNILNFAFTVILLVFILWFFYAVWVN